MGTHKRAIEPISADERRDEQRSGNENAPEPAGYEAGSRGALEGGEVLREE
jgi:hypothetical protein